MAQRFGTKMDNTVKIITTIVHFGIIPIPFFLYAQSGLTDTLILLLVLTATFLPAYLMRPFEYVVDEEQITIHKSVFAKKIPLQQIASISTIEYKELKVRLRLWGSGGLWGWYGIFLSTEYGKINLQITEKSNLLLITTKDDKYIVLSPSEPIAFAEHVKKAMRVLK